MWGTLHNFPTSSTFNYKGKNIGYTYQAIIIDNNDLCDCYLDIGIEGPANGIVKIWSYGESLT